MFLIVEGDDRTGKDTLISGICKATNWEFIVIPRGPAGYATYDDIYKRSSKERFSSFVESAKAIKQSSYVVAYCYANPLDLFNRRSNEEDDGTHPETPKHENISVEDIEKRLSIYKNYVESLYDKDKIVYLNSSKLSPSEMVLEVLSKCQSKH